MYVEKIDKNGKLCISTCAHTSFGTQQKAKPTAQQRSCPHPFESLVWGANGSAHYARCDRCKLKHVIYYDVHAQEVLVANKTSRQGENIARPRPSSTPSRRPGAAEESSAAETDADATGTVTRKCAHPECTYQVHTSPDISETYCCKMCQAAHEQEEDPAHGKKCHGKEYFPPLPPAPRPRREQAQKHVSRQDRRQDMSEAQQVRHQVVQFRRQVVQRQFPPKYRQNKA